MYYVLYLYCLLLSIQLGILTYSRKACDTCFGISGTLKSTADCLPLIIVGKIDLERSKSVANDCNKNAKNANDANTLMGSKALKYILLSTNYLCNERRFLMIISRKTYW